MRRGVLAVLLLLLGVPAVAGASLLTTGDGAQRACQIAWRGYNRNDTSRYGPSPKTVRRVVNAFDEEGIPKALTRAANRLIDSDEGFHDFGTLVIACARLGYLSADRAQTVEQLRGLDPSA